MPKRSQLSKRFKLGFFGLFFFLLGLIWVGLISPEFEKIPDDFSYSAELISIDNFYDTERGEFSGEQYSRTGYDFRAIEKKGDALIIENHFSVETLDGEPIIDVTRNYAIDPYTTAHLPEWVSLDRSGYLFAPPGIKKGEAFEYWHATHDRASKMQFIKEEYLYGLRTYHYEAAYDEGIDQTDLLGDLPGVGEELGVVQYPELELWVEPSSGKLVKFKDSASVYFYDLETGEDLYPRNTFANTFSEESVEEKAKEVNSFITERRVFSFLIPGLLFLLALIFLGKSLEFWKLVFDKIGGRWVKKTVCLVNLALPSLSILGWLLGINVLTTLIFSGSGLNPLTSILFILMGLALAINLFSKKHTFIYFGTFILAVSFARLLSYYEFIQFTPDLFLFKEAILSAPNPSRMGLFATTSLMLLSIGFITLHLKSLKRLYVPEIIGASFFVLSLLAVASYLFGADWIVKSSIFYSTSLQTAILVGLNSYLLIDISFESKRISLSKRNEAIIFFLLVSFISLSIVSGLYVERVFYDEARSNFDDLVSSTSASIEDRLAIYINTLNGAKGLFAASDNVERAEWVSYVESLDVQKNYPGIQGLGYSVFVKPEQLNAHIQSVRNEGFPEFTVNPEYERDIYTSIIYLEPFDVRNQQAFGYDMFTNNIRRSAMEQARDTNEGVMSGRITLVQEIDEDVQAGFLIYLPVYKNGLSHDTLEERRENILGYVYAPFRARDFIEAVIGIGGIDSLSLRINDGANSSEEDLLYTDKEFSHPRFTRTEVLYIAGRPWTLNFSSSQRFGTNLFNQITPSFVLLLGVIFSLFVSLIFYSFGSAEARAGQYAEKATKKLRAKTRQLERINARDEAILDSIGDGLMVTDKDGIIVFMNDAFEAITGWKASEALHEPLARILPMKDENGKPIKASARLIIKTLRNKRTYHHTDFQYQKKNGELFPASITVAPIITNNTVIGAVEIFRDISLEKEVEQAKTEFVSLASHQLRTPLSAINWNSEMLLSGEMGKLSKKQQAVLKDIFDSNHIMVELVDDLLNVSRIEVGHFLIEPEMTDIVALIKDVIDEEAASIKKKKIKLNTNLSKRFPEVKVDAKLMRIVFQNLLSNAVKYSPDGKHIKIELTKNKRYWDFVISDQGYGIPKKDHHKVFSKLFRAENAISHETEGTGLGLYIIKSVIDESGGSITFESEENKGTTFKVRFPLSGMKKKSGERRLTQKEGSI